MKYSVEKQDDYAIMTLAEENLNSVKAPDLKSEFVVLKNQGIRNLILNLEIVKYVDSSGLSAILTGNRLWSDDEGLFVLTGVVHPSVKMLINISRLDSVLDIKDNTPEAVKWIMMQTLRSELSSNASATEEEGDEE
jgi:anti-sigma B factor antagonist